MLLGSGKQKNLLLESAKRLNDLTDRLMLASLGGLPLRVSSDAKPIGAKPVSGPPKADPTGRQLSRSLGDELLDRAVKQRQVLRPAQPVIAVGNHSEDNRIAENVLHQPG